MLRKKAIATLLLATAVLPTLAVSSFAQTRPEAKPPKTMTFEFPMTKLSEAQPVYFMDVAQEHEKGVYSIDPRSLIGKQLIFNPNPETQTKAARPPRYKEITYCDGVYMFGGCFGSWKKVVYKY